MIRIWQKIHFLSTSEQATKTTTISCLIKIQLISGIIQSGASLVWKLHITFVSKSRSFLDESKIKTFKGYHKIMTKFYQN